jgi:hypothetical protein
MPRATRNTDLRRTGRGDNTTGVVHGKSNLQDQRKAGAYTPPVPSADSEFKSGISAGKPMSAGAPVGQGTRRSVGRIGKIGGKD